MQASSKISSQIGVEELSIGPKIGKGGYGEVFKGKWNQFTDVAIKQFFQEKLTQVAEQEFQNELQIMQDLRHPNIVTFYGFCLNPATVVMELMEGSLYQLLQSNEEMQ